MWTVIQEELLQRFHSSKKVQQNLPIFQQQIANEQITAGYAADKLISDFLRDSDLN
jgi:hypothetical protein